METRLRGAGQAATRDAADKARKAATYAVLWMFISLLVGAFMASLTAIYGGRRRDPAIPISSTHQRHIMSIFGNIISKIFPGSHPANTTTAPAPASAASASHSAPGSVASPVPAEPSPAAREAPMLAGRVARLG